MTENGCEPEAWKFLAVCVPIVVFFAPFGSMLSSHLHRQVLAALIYILDTVALVSKAVNIKVSDNCLFQKKILKNILRNQTHYQKIVKCQHSCLVNVVDFQPSCDTECK